MDLVALQMKPEPLGGQPGSPHRRRAEVDPGRVARTKARIQAAKSVLDGASLAGRGVTVSAGNEKEKGMKASAKGLALILAGGGGHGGQHTRKPGFTPRGILSGIFSLIPVQAFLRYPCKVRFDSCLQT